MATKKKTHSYAPSDWALLVLPAHMLEHDKCAIFKEGEVEPAALAVLTSMNLGARLSMVSIPISTGFLEPVRLSPNALQGLFSRHECRTLTTVKKGLVPFFYDMKASHSLGRGFDVYSVT